jgi:hypothetical protein
VLLRLWVRKDAAWVQYVPSVIGCAWGLVYFWTRRLRWDWLRHGSLLMLVSLVSAPYSWLYDQVVAVPALLRGAFVTRSRSMLATLAFLSALIEVALFGIVWKPATLYLWTLWSGPAWLIWYVYAVSLPAQRLPGQVAAQVNNSEATAP